MNKKNNRKGFTIVELVIVIAVIAVLATVLVPTFGNVIAKANNTALIQEIKNEHTSYVTEYADKDGYSDTVYILMKDDEGEAVFYLVEKGEIQMKTENNLEVPETQAMPTGDVVVFCAEHNLVAEYVAASGTGESAVAAHWECDND